MDDQTIQILLKAKNETQAAFMSAGLDLKTFGDKSQAALLKAQGYAKKFSDEIFSMKGALVGIAGIAGLGIFIDKSLKAADAVGKTADRIGISTTALQEYRYAAGISGVETANLDSGLQKFSKNLGEARNNTGTLVTFLRNYDQTLLKNIQTAKSSDEALQMIFEAMGNAASAADRAALANAAFGRAGVDMTVMVKDGAEGLAGMKKEANDLGQVMSDSMIRSAEKADDAISRLTGTIKIEAMSAFVELAPTIEKAANATTEWLKVHKDFRDSLKTSVSYLGEHALPAVLDFADAWVKTWQAAGLASAGVISWRDALLDGVAAIDRFDQAQKRYQIGPSTPGYYGVYKPLPAAALPKTRTTSEMDKTAKQMAADNAKLWQYEVNAAVAADKEMADAYAGYGDYQKKINEQAKKDAAEQAKAYRDMYADLGDQAGNYFGASLDMLKKRKQNYIDLTYDQVLAEQWFSNEYEKLLIKQAQKSDDFIKGLQGGFLQLKRDQVSWGKAAFDSVTAFYNSSTAATADFINFSKDTFGDFKSFFQHLLDDMAGYWSQMLARMINDKAMGGLASLLGIPAPGSTGSGIIGNAGSLFGIGSTGASGMTMAASTAHEAALGGAMPAAASWLPGIGVAAMAVSMFSAMGSRQQMAPSAQQYLDAWKKNLSAVPGWEGADAGHGGPGWRSHVTEAMLQQWMDAIKYGWGAGTIEGGGETPHVSKSIVDQWFKETDFPSFDVGTNYVPRDMLALVHKGEKITPAGGGSPSEIYVTIHFNDNRLKDLIQVEADAVYASNQQDGTGTRRRRLRITG
jgi:hypothetical protein